MKIVGYCGEWKPQAVTRLVTYAVQACRQFALVAAEYREDEAMEVLHDLMPYLVMAETVSAWPGTIKLDGETRRMLKFRIEPAVISMLVEDIMPVLFLPAPPIEDLGMLRADGRPYLVMITHEQDVFLKLESQELGMLASAIGSRDLQIQGDDEVPDEAY